MLLPILVGYALWTGGGLLLTALASHYLSGCKSEPEKTEERWAGFIDPKCDECHAPNGLYNKGKIDAHKFHFNPVLRTKTGYEMISKAITCEKCHPVPDVNDMTKAPHRDGTVQTNLKEYDPQFEASCEACHYKTVDHKKDWEVEYTKPKSDCNSCHEKVKHHDNISEPANSREMVSLCKDCHDATITSRGGVYIEKHIDGTVDKNEDINLLVEGTCLDCHTDIEDDTVHASHGHLRPDRGKWISNPISCRDARCHSSIGVLLRLDEHMNDATKGLRAFFPNETITAHGNNPLSCKVACHGMKELSWRPTELNCENSCHKETDPKHDVSDAEIYGENLELSAAVLCSECHSETMNPDGSIKSFDKHIDFEVQFLPNTPEGNCAVCHEFPPAKHIDGIEDPEVMASFNDPEHCADCHTSAPEKPFRTSEQDPHRNGTIDIREIEGSSTGVFSGTESVCTKCHTMDPPESPVHFHTESDIIAAYSTAAGDFTVGISCDNCHSGIETMEAGALYTHQRQSEAPYIKMAGRAVIIPADDGEPIYPTVVIAPDGKISCSNTNCHDSPLLTERDTNEVPTAPATPPLPDRDRCSSCHSSEPPPSATHEVYDTCAIPCHSDPKRKPFRHIDKDQIIDFE